MPALTVLQLNPSEVLEFPSAKLRSVSIELNLKNVSDKCVAYKIKTTAPKSYLVRPSTGVVAPGEEQDVQIILQPQQTLPESNKDRFLVQAIEVDSADVALTRDFWISKSKELLQKHRFSVVFKPSEEAAVSPRAADASSVNPSPPSPSSPSSLPSSDPSSLPSSDPSSLPSSDPSSLPSTDSSTALIASHLQCPSAFPPPAVSDLEAKYNDLLQSYLSLEKQKTAVANELSEAQQQVEALKYRLKEALQRARRCPWGFFS